MNITCTMQDPLEKSAPVLSNAPVRSLVTVRFPNWNSPLTYYNDRFDLHPGDQVFVSGKLAGFRGTVVSLTTKFKIRLSDYERVIACPRISFRGTYELIADRFVSFEANALSADTFRAWALPPREAVQNSDAAQNSGSEETTVAASDPAPEDDIVLGEGYSVALNDIEHAEDVKPVILSRALEYCDEDRVLFLNITDGVGTAFVSGTQIYEINFKLFNLPEQGWQVSDLYCDCPYPGLCKHALAALFTLKEILAAIPPEKSTTGGTPNFTSISQSLFWSEIRKNLKTVTIADGQ